MTMSAMCREDWITRGQMRADSGCDRFLTNIRVTGTVNESTLVTPRELFFRLPNDLHRVV